MRRCDLGEGICFCDAYMLFLIRANNCFKKSVGKPALPFLSFVSSVHRCQPRGAEWQALCSAETQEGIRCGSHLWRASESREGVGEPLSGCEKEEHTRNAGETGALSQVWGPGTFTHIHTPSQWPQWRVQIKPLMEG